ncbi:arylsulfatase [Spirochaetia bacterium]|nr:arylsulfatase [Spirochaetia bacterium]
MAIRTDKRPNILLITADQQRYDTIGAGGRYYMKTPNLDLLAREGCMFSHAYSPNPVCIPARHNLLTGLSARYHGFDDNYFDEIRSIPYNLPTFPQILSDSGYDTIAIGKMHFQPYRRHNGFHRLYLMDEIPRYREDDDYAVYLREQKLGNIQSIHGVRHLLYMLPQRSLVPEEHHGSKWVADKTIEYLDENNGKRPFLMWSGFIAPHPPFDVPDSWADLYKGVSLPAPAKTKTPLSALAEENKHIADYPDESYLRRARELYFAAISFVDHQVGRILFKLREIGQIDNTLIIYTSDHGEMLGDLGTYQKFLPYDFASRIPMIIRYPQRIKQGSLCDDFVDLNDLLPTMLDAADVNYPDKNISLPGESLFKNSGQKDRSVQYVEHCKDKRRWVSLRSKSYKYNYYYGGAYKELFDMTSDPQETMNLLYDNPSMEHLAIATGMHRQLAEIEAVQGLEGYIQNGDFIGLEPYHTQPYREMNFPLYPSQLTKQVEIEHQNTIEDEILIAIEKEPIVNLEALDLETFKIKSGLKDKQVNEILMRWQQKLKDAPGSAD